MASETQILANRPNAQESDRPRTAPMEKSTVNTVAPGDYFMQNKPNFQKVKWKQALVQQRIMTINPNGHLVKTNPIQSQSKPILERMNINFCATGYYESKPAFAVRRTRLKRDGKPIAVWMHREITKAGDHINHNGLDNRKANLRLATRSQNAWNRRKPNVKSRSKYKGVSWYNRGKRWNARIQVNGKQKFLGIFADEIEAAKAYDTAARKYHGEFAALNFDKEDNARAGVPGKVSAGNCF